jgi:hypothetical protein
LPSPWDERLIVVMRRCLIEDAVRYPVFPDDRAAGECGRSGLRLPVSPGRHTLQLRIGCFRS